MAKFFGASLHVVTESFFDRAAVVNAMDKKTNAAFRWIGGTLRKTARRSIKPSTSQTLHSPKGKPVRSPSGLYKETIFFEYDPRRHSLIVGPKKLPIKSDVTPSNRKSIPELLEKGGTGHSSKPTFRLVKKAKKKKRQKRSDGFVWVKIPPGQRTYDERPTMRLAWKKTVNRKNLKRAFETIGFKR